MARAISRKIKRSRSYKVKRSMRRKSTECSRIPASACSAVNPSCVARKVRGRRSKICVRRRNVRKGVVYEGPSIV